MSGKNVQSDSNEKNHIIRLGKSGLRKGRIMRDRVIVTGIVLMATPVGDYDKRLVILTKERGRITAFCRGARRTNSVLLAPSNPFCFGEFELYEGRDAYTVSRVSVKEYFREIITDPQTAAYGFYFLEIANYYTRENADESQMLKLLYLSLKALMSDKFQNLLVRRIYEMKALVINGEYPVMSEETPYKEATIYALQFITITPVEKLYSFKVTEDVLEEIGRILDAFMEKYIDREFSSLKLLEL